VSRGSGIHAGTLPPPFDRPQRPNGSPPKARSECRTIQAAGRSAARQRTWFGTRRSAVRIRPPRQMKRSLSVSLALPLVFALAAPALHVTAAPLGPSALTLLPNLVTLRIGDLSIDRRGGVRLLRFANVVGNRGPGVLELFPVADDCDGNGDPQDDRSAHQRVYADTDGNGVFDRDVDEVAAERFVGCMFFHPQHNHWHLEDFARYVLTKPKDGRIVAESDKVSFCVRDSIPRWRGLPGAPRAPYYRECTQDGTTGMSVGWADVYGADLFGQTIDVTGVPDGRYCLTSIADPSLRIEERLDDDNSRSMLIRILGSTVRQIGTGCVS
jgi:Lysyl oxidase